MASSLTASRPASGLAPAFDTAVLGVSSESLRRYEEPVFCIGGDGFRPGNPLAQEFATRLSPEDLDKLAAAARRAATQDRAVVDMLDVGQGAHLQHLQITIVPLSDSAGALVFVRDLTLDNTLRVALVESRRRYKDFIDISADFPWEISRARRFVFVPSRGAMGYTPEALIASDPATLVASDVGFGTDMPFLTTRRIESEEFWLKRADGRTACVVVSAMPLTDTDGRWIGARGVCRDVTDARDRENTLTRVRNRERVLTRIIRAFRDEVDPLAMLNVAADALARGLGAEHCQIFRVAPDDADATATLGVQLAASFGDGVGTDTAAVLSSLANGAAAAEMVLGDWQVLASPALYQSGSNGAAVLWRKIERGPWTDDDRLLISDIANQIGITIAQLTNHERMLRLARTDGLTGLLNRSAFVDGLQRFIMRQDRNAPGSMTSTLIYVDLDNFKPVNDTFGHQTGDLVLQKARDILVQQVRPTDMVARLGGDEFALWLNTADLAIGVQRAERLLKAAADLAPFSAGTEKPLGFSIGIALWTPGDEKLDHLLARADAAMYQAKRGGKGRYAVSTAAEA